jgi:hypothetical protein
MWTGESLVANCSFHATRTCWARHEREALPHWDVGRLRAAARARGAVRLLLDCAVPRSGCLQRVHSGARAP